MIRKNKFLWIVLPTAALLIAAVCVIAVVLIFGQKKEEKYYKQMQSARQHMLDGDYEQVIADYKAAIELRPEDVDAYIGLVQAYMDNGQYVEASETANLGLTATRDKRLEELVQQIMEKRFTRGNDGEDKSGTGEYFVVAGEDSEKLALRTSMLDAFSDYCYQEILDNYGDSSVSYVSADVGYKFKFRGLNANVYFKNTSQYPHLIDTANRKPEKNARPYKYAILSPAVIFVGFEGYISQNHLWELVHTTEPEYDKTEKIYKVSFEWNDSVVKIETDAEGNIYKEDALVEIYPKTLEKTDWEEVVEETETEEETQDPNTFTLGSQTFTYDVEVIDIYGENIGSLEPLSKCKNLKYLFLRDCTIDGLEPLAQCQALERIDLMYTLGFSDLSPLAELQNLVFLSMHECKDVSDISVLMDKEIKELHVCGTAVSYEQTEEYYKRHPNCSVWYDYTEL